MNYFIVIFFGAARAINGTIPGRIHMIVQF